MAKLWVVIKREYLERVQNKWFVISTLLAPLFFSALIFLPALLTLRSMRSAQVANIIILDATGAGMGARVDSSIRAARPRAEAGGVPAADPGMQVRVVEPGAPLAQAESLASRDVRAGTAGGYLVLDAGSLAGDSARYAGPNASSRAVVDKIERAARDVSLGMRLEGAGIDPAKVQQLTSKRLRLSAERLTATGRGRTGMGNVMFGMAVTLLLYLSIILYGQNVMRGVMEEKQTRVAEVVVSSVSPDKLLAGKILGVGAVGLTQQILWFALTAGIGAYVAPFFAKSARAVAQDMMAQGGSAGARDMSAMMGGMPSITIGQVALLLVFFLIGYFLYSALFAAVGAMVNDEREAQQALGPVMILLIGSSFLMQPVMFNPSSDLARWASLIPFSSPIIMPLRMTMVQVPPLEIAASVAGGLLMVFLFSWLAARIYRVGLLMYGKKPSMAELARWVRQAA